MNTKELNLRTRFDLIPGDEVWGPDVDKTVTGQTRTAYKVVSVHPKIFIIRKLDGNHRELGLPKSAYLTGEVQMKKRKAK